MLMVQLFKIYDGSNMLKPLYVGEIAQKIDFQVVNPDPEYYPLVN